MIDVQKIEKLCNRIPRLFPGVKSAWFSQGFIGVELNRSRNAEFIKIDDVPTGEIISTVANQMAIILRKEE